MLHIGAMGAVAVESGPDKRARLREDRLERIVEVTVRLAEEGGIDAVRSRSICQQADVSMGTLYRHFGSIEEILLYSFANDFKDFEHRFPNGRIPGTTPMERVEAFFEEATSAMTERPRYGRAVVIALASGQDKALQQVAALNFQITNLIEAAWTGKPAEPPNDYWQPSRSRVIARTLERVWFSTLVGWAASFHSPKDVVREVCATADLFLDSQT